MRYRNAGQALDPKANVGPPTSLDALRGLDLRVLDLLARAQPSCSDWLAWTPLQRQQFAYAVAIGVDPGDPRAAFVPDDYAGYLRDIITSITYTCSQRVVQAKMSGGPLPSGLDLQYVPTGQPLGPDYLWFPWMDQGPAQKTAPAPAPAPAPKPAPAPSPAPPSGDSGSSDTQSAAQALLPDASTAIWLGVAVLAFGFFVYLNTSGTEELTSSYRSNRG